VQAPAGLCATGHDRSLGLGADETGVVYRVEIKMVEESETYFEQCVVDAWPE
jgi:hypothetical protein